MENRNLDSYRGTSGTIVYLTPDFDGPAANWFVQNTDATFSNYIDFGWQTRTVRLYGGMSMALEIEAKEVSVQGSGAAYIVTAMGSDSNPVTLKKEAGGGSGSADTGEVVTAATTSGSKHSVTKTKTISRPTVDAAAFFELPAAASATEYADYVVKDGKGIGGAHTITVTAAGGTIDGAASATITSNYGALVFVSDGTNYSIL